MQQTEPVVHILALDSATSVCDVALLSIRGTHKQLYTRQHSASSGHAEAVLPMIQSVLQEAEISRQQLTAVAFGQGPGAFTGLRVACGVAQGLAYALEIPVVPVVSLHALAQAGSGDEAVRVVAQDARMNELYVAAYVAAHDRSNSEGFYQPLCEPVLMAVADLPLWLAQQPISTECQQICLLGNACEAYPELHDLKVPGLALRWQTQAGAQVAMIAELAWRFWQQGQTLAPAQAAPLYVRDKVAYTTAERERGQGGNPRTSIVTAPLTATVTPNVKTATPIITPMLPGELEAVLEIERRTQMYPWTRGQIQDSLHANCEGWVIREEAGSQVCGFYLLMKAPDVAHLLLLGVQPERQRRGLGYQLLRHCETRTEQLALSALLLEVRPSNRKALDFYRNRGFVQIGLRKGYYPNGRDDRMGREDALVMQKQLQL